MRKMQQRLMKSKFDIGAIFSRNGSLLATTCKDKKIRIIDPRNGEVLRTGDCHKGTKASKVRKYEEVSGQGLDEFFQVWLLDPALPAQPTG